MARHYSRQYQWQHECKYRSGWAQPPVKRVSVLLRNGNNAILHRLEQGYSRLIGCKDLSHSLVSWFLCRTASLPLLSTSLFSLHTSTSLFSLHTDCYNTCSYMYKVPTRPCPKAGDQSATWPHFYSWFTAGEGSPGLGLTNDFCFSSVGM